MPNSVENAFFRTQIGANYQDFILKNYASISENLCPNLIVDEIH